MICFWREMTITLNDCFLDTDFGFIQLKCKSGKGGKGTSRKEVQTNGVFRATGWYATCTPPSSPFRSSVDSLWIHRLLVWITVGWSHIKASSFEAGGFEFEAGGYHYKICVNVILECRNTKSQLLNCMECILPLLMYIFWAFCLFQ